MDGGVYSGERHLSYAELFRHAAQAARGYASLEVGVGDAVALLLRNDPAFLECSLGTAVLGAMPVPINWHWRAEEVGHLLRDCGAKVLAVHEDLLGPIAGAIPDGVTVVSVPTPPEVRAAYGTTASAAGDVRYADWLADLEPWDELPEQAPHSIIYTSGTTGRPKGVVRRPQDPEAAEEMRAVIAELFGLREGARTVIPAPLYHTAPNVYALGSAMRQIEMTLMPRFEPEAFLRIVEERRITTVQMVPTMFVRLLQLPEEVRRRYDTSSLEVVVHAAAPCPPDVKHAMIDWLGPVVTEYYGGTETGAVVHCTSEEWLAHPGTVGKPLPGGRIEIVGDDGRVLGPGEPGEVYMWLDAWPDFTYSGDEEKRRSVEWNGLVSCGDIGYVDADGFLYLNDRRSDMVISGGVNIYPAEIEACLLGLEGVRDCAVFGIPDEGMGEAVCACVDADPAAGLTPEAVRDHVATRLAGYKAPKVVEFRDDLPREDSGKVFKRLLREPYWAGQQRRI